MIPNYYPSGGCTSHSNEEAAGSGYYSGEAISNFNEFDDVVGHTVAEEISLQLDIMKQMGVNTITYELRSPTQFLQVHMYFHLATFLPDLGCNTHNPLQQRSITWVHFLTYFKAKELKLFLRLVILTWKNNPLRTMSSG